MKIRKAVIPAAGWGTRFLPWTKAMPKEMLPIVDRPVIQFVVEEIAQAGIQDVILVTGWHKRAIEDHFDRSMELEKFLEKNNKQKECDEIKRIAGLANFVYIRQKGEKYGNAVPVLCAEPAIGKEPFLVVWGDEFIYAQPSRIQQMLDVYEKNGGIVISAMKIDDPNALTRYGVADLVSSNGNVHQIKGIVEKPEVGKAPSNLALLGAYILPPEVFDAIKGIDTFKGEYYLVDAIRKLMADGVPAYACEIQNGKYYDTGNKFEYLKTNVEFGLKDKEYGEKFKDYLKNLDI
ncbi:MAG TPA: UTP--glucose-1-phosphate uridylyltransferase [Candidatus Pacearchaeota archaeon]|nr:UTP--glucose-1-phosphate uridylyltransferase [Candidatus Pacearchaeota archaeon]